MELIQHRYSDGSKRARYYIDGRRVDAYTFDATKNIAIRAGKRLTCLYTKAKQLPGGHFHRINYSSIN